MAKRLSFHLLLVVLASLMVVALLPLAAGAASPLRTYTLDADFDEGVLSGVQHDDPAHDQLQLSAQQVTLPFIWVANSNESTVSKIDTVTGDELGRYRTGPGNENPSRTTVDLNGDVWVGNRNTGTAVKIALVVNQDTNGDGDIKTSYDKNGNGIIDVGDPDELLPWGQDDAVLMRIDTPDGTRALAVDALNNVWIGGTLQDLMTYYDGDTGVPIKTIPVGRDCYGALIDANGTLFISNDGQRSMTRIDNPSGAHTVTLVTPSPVAWVYGLGIDSQGFVYSSGWTENRLRKYDPATSSWVWDIPAAGIGGRGVCVGLDGDIWVAHSYSNAVTRHRAVDGMLIATVPVGSTPTGVAVDAAGKIWVTNFGSNDVMRIDPATNAVDFAQGNHPGPYNYSDMTGMISRTITTKTGTWTADCDSGTAGTDWSKVAWNGEPQGFVPAGTALTVRVRSSDDGATWSAWEDASNGSALAATPDGRYLQVEATLRVLSGDVSPVLSDLTVYTESETPTPVPAMSGWFVAAGALTLAVAGLLVLRSRRPGQELA